MSTPDHLYKFLPSEGALKVLEAGALRFSAVELWADPFELTSFSPLTFDANKLREGAVSLASSMIFGPEDPKGDVPLVHAITRWRHEKRFDSVDEAHSVLGELLADMIDHRWEQLQAALHEWQAYCRNARYCCFCGRHDTLSAWETYADHHRGVALRFDHEQGTPWDNARAVTYGSERPEFTSLREQLAALLHNRNEQIARRFPDLHFARPNHRKPEQEWRSQIRAAHPVDAEQKDFASWFEDRKFQSSDLKAVYFGLATEAEARNRLGECLAQKYPHTKIFQAVKGKAGYALDFVRAKQ